MSLVPARLHRPRRLHEGAVRRTSGFLAAAPRERVASDRPTTLSFLVEDDDDEGTMTLEVQRVGPETLSQPPLEPLGVAELVHL